MTTGLNPSPSARITHTGGKRLLDAPVSPGVALFSDPLPVAIYGGGAVTLLAAPGVPGLLSVEGSMDLCISWTHTFLGPLRLMPETNPQTINFSTTDAHGSPYSGCTHYRVKFEALQLAPHVEVVHISGCGQEYRDGRAVLPSGVLPPLARLKRWAANLRVRPKSKGAPQ